MFYESQFQFSTTSHKSLIQNLYHLKGQMLSSPSKRMKFFFAIFQLSLKACRKGEKNFPIRVSSWKNEILLFYVRDLVKRE